MTTPKLSKIFVRLVDRYGRNYEFGLLSRFYLRTNPLGLLGLLPLAVRLMIRRRLAIFPRRIEKKDELRKIIEYLEKERIKAKG
jgi:hypothetical protein